MRLYKLLKDTPTIKAGTIFREVVSDYDGAMELARVTPIGAKTSPQFTIQDIDNFEEWFEEIEEPIDSIHWKPKIGEVYWSRYSNEEIVCFTWNKAPWHAAMYKVGRVYRTKEECKQARDRELAEVRLRRTSTFDPDFEDRNGGWAVGYNHRLKMLICSNIPSADFGEPVRYATAEDARRSIEENEGDWKIYFGIKEEE